MEFRRRARPRLSTHRLYGPVGALGRRWVREASWAWVALVNRVRGLKKRSTRVSPHGGFTACVTGRQPDATWVAERLVAWLAPDMAVLPALGTRSSIRARWARGRGLIVIADHLTDPEEDQPDLIIRLSEPSNGASGLVHAGAPPTIDLDSSAGLATILFQAQRAIWERI